MEIIELLKQFGLSSKEIKVYLTSLELGPASISNIAKKAALKRPTVHLIVEGLLDKKFLYKVLKGKRTFYHAEHPAKVVNDLKDKLAKVEELVPALESRYKHPLPKPQIRFYEGKSGLKKVYEEIVRSSAKVLTCVSMERFLQVFDEKEMQRLLTLARENATKLNDLLEQSEAAKKYAKAAERKGIGPIKFLPEGFKLSTDILICGNKVAMISFDDLVALVIEDQAITKTQKKFLRFLWTHL